MTLIAQALAPLTLGPPTRFENLTLVPLLDGQAAEAQYLTLGDALGAGAIAITEVSDAGRPWGMPTSATMPRSTATAGASVPTAVSGVPSSP